MICKTCQSENPESNRFCGNCGSRLQGSEVADQSTAAHDQGVRASGPPKASQADSVTRPSVRRPFIVSTTVTGDVASQTTNSRVSFPSRSVSTASYSGFSGSLKPRVEDEEQIAHGEGLVEPAPPPVDPADEPMFSQAGVHDFDESPQHEIMDRLDRMAAEPASSKPTLVSDTPGSGSILGLTAPIAYQETESVQEPLPPFQYDTPQQTVEDQQTDVSDEPGAPHDNDFRHSFFQFDEPGDHSSSDVSGPSFLGLGAPTSQDYLLEEEAPPSHWRRNLLLLILVIFATLGVLEWRASQQGDSTNPMDVLHLKLPKKKGQGQAEVSPGGETPSGANNASGTANNNGKPDLIAEPNQSATKSSPATDQPDSAAPKTDATAQPAQPTPTPTANPPAEAPVVSTVKPSEPPATAAKSTPAEPPAKTPPQAQATKPAPAESVAKVTPPAKPSASGSAAPRRAASAEAKDGAPPVEADPSLSGGSFELQKGIAAGPTELGRMWLWKAMGKGNGEAPVLLADMYAQGQGVPKDCEQAMLLLNAAAKKANPRARSKLGSMYATGECVARDRVQAYKWMSAALQVNPGSDWLEKNRETLMNQMTPAERRRAEAYR
jgi:hypothetical protein